MKHLPLFLLTSLLSLPLSANLLGFTFPQNLPMMRLPLPMGNNRTDGTVYEEKGAEKIKYVYAGSQRVAQISSTQGTTYFTNDHQGSASLLTDTSGAQVQSMAYLPFGGTFQTAGSKTTSWRYTGQRQDDSTGLYYYNARYYDPTIGRFLTPDTIVQSPYDPQFLNRYAYCRNNPINLVDPTGHTAQQDDENEYGLYLDLTGTHQVTPEPPPTLDDERPRNNSGDQSRDDAFQSWLPGFLDGSYEYQRQAELKKEQEREAAIARQKEFNFGHAGLKEGWMPTGHGMSNATMFASAGGTGMGLSDMLASIPGAQAGEDSAEWYADQYNAVNGFAAVPFWVGGVASSAWTPDTAWKTSLALSVAYAGAGWAASTGPTMGELLGSDGPLFGRYGKGVFNNNAYFRNGWGWNADREREVFRTVIGNKKLPIHLHLDWW